MIKKQRGKRTFKENSLFTKGYILKRGKFDLKLGCPEKHKDTNPLSIKELAFCVLLAV
jgi:hypothetical protein